MNSETKRGWGSGLLVVGIGLALTNVITGSTFGLVLGGALALAGIILLAGSRTRRRPPPGGGTGAGRTVAGGRSVRGVIVDAVSQGGWVLALGIFSVVLGGFSSYMAHRRVWEGALLGALLSWVGVLIEWVVIAVAWRNRPTRA